MLPGWQDHSGLQAASSYQPLYHQSLANSFHMGRVPDSTVCLCMYVCSDCISAFFAQVCLVAFLPLLWGIFLTPWYRISHNREWEDIETAGGKGEKGREIAQRWEAMCGWIVSKSICMAWVLINLPEIPYFSTSAKPRGIEYKHKVYKILLLSASFRLTNNIILHMQHFSKLKRNMKNIL